MILGVDSSREIGARTGVGRFIEHLLEAWSRHPMPFDQVRIFSQAPIRDLPKDKRFVPVITPARGPGLWWYATGLRRQAEQVDVLFAPYVLPLRFRGRSVLYNLGIYEGKYAPPGLRARARSRHLAYSARRANHVLAMCPSVKRDLIHWYDVAPERVSVVWPGLDPTFRPATADEGAQVDAAVTEHVGGDAPYFLFVGKLAPRRNVPSLIEGFARATLPRSDTKLLLVGPNPGVPLHRITAELGIRDRVRHVPHLETETLSSLYRSASAFVMPTVNEGFSLTIQEALASGCPVITLRGAQLGVMEYLDGPRDHSEGGPVLEAPDASSSSLAEAMSRLAGDGALHAELRRRGLLFAATFPSWDDSATEIMDVLAEVADSGRSPLRNRRDEPAP